MSSTISKYQTKIPIIKQSVKKYKSNAQTPRQTNVSCINKQNNTTNTKHTNSTLINKKQFIQTISKYKEDALLQRVFNNVHYLDSVRYYADVESECEDDDKIPISAEGIMDTIEEITRDMCKIILGHVPDVVKKHNKLEITEFDSVCID